MAKNNKIYECVVCGFRYYEEKGLPEEGIAAGTCWQEVPEHWLCPHCRVGKSDFELVIT